MENYAMWIMGGAIFIWLSPILFAILLCVTALLSNAIANQVENLGKFFFIAILSNGLKQDYRSFLKENSIHPIKIHGMSRKTLGDIFWMGATKRGGKIVRTENSFYVRERYFYERNSLRKLANIIRLPARSIFGMVP